MACPGAAKGANVSLVGAVPDRVTAAEAADAGQRSIDHLTNVLRGCSRDEPKLMREQFYGPAKEESPAEAHARVVRWQREILDSYSQSVAGALIAKFARNSVWQTPTLVLLQNDAFPTLQDAASQDPALKYIRAVTLDIWKQDRAEQMRFVTPAESELRANLLAKSANVVAEMQRAGVEILAGTDSPAPYVVPGFSLHHELELLVQAGLTPLQALQAATSRAAEFLGESSDSGTVAAGKYADLVLLDANPLENIRSTQKIRAVILRGQFLDRPNLDKFLQEVQAFAFQR